MTMTSSSENRSPGTSSIASLAFALYGLLGWGHAAWAQSGGVTDDVRRSAAVTVMEKAQPAVAAVYAYGQNKRSSGSASVIDPRGYVLTVKHLILDQHIVLLGGRPPMRAELVGTMPEFDIALLKIGEPAFNRPGSPDYARNGEPLDCLPLGIDAQVRAGETILNIGSPGGRGIIVTQGIVSAVSFTGINPLATATQSATAFDELLQFDAASNPGNSGGPVVNLLGQQIGMAVSGVHSEEGIHFALPLKTIRQSIPVILNSEFKHRYVSGITVDPQLNETLVVQVADGSPAAAAGIQVGDKITSVDGRELRDSIDWEFTRYHWRCDDRVTLGIQRAEQTLSIPLTLVPRKAQSSVSADQAKPGCLCRWAPYDPQIPRPIDDDSKPTGQAWVIDTVRPTDDRISAKDHYELEFQGLLNIKKAGVYRLGLRSDDGSRLYLHDRLLIENGGNHSPILRTAWVDLEAGMHPVRIEFYEDEGEQALEVLIAKDDEELEPVTAEQWYHLPPKDSTE